MINRVAKKQLNTVLIDVESQATDSWDERNLAMMRAIKSPHPDIVHEPVGLLCHSRNGVQRFVCECELHAFCLHEGLCAKSSEQALVRAA